MSHTIDPSLRSGWHQWAAPWRSATGAEHRPQDGPASFPRVCASAGEQLQWRSWLRAPLEWRVPM